MIGEGPVLHRRLLERFSVPSSLRFCSRRQFDVASSLSAEVPFLDFADFSYFAYFASFACFCALKVDRGECMRLETVS